MQTAAEYRYKNAAICIVGTTPPHIKEATEKFLRKVAQKRKEQNNVLDVPIRPYPQKLG